MTALSILFGVLMFATALFLILLVLVQRGRGGGLSGALGGMGGQSAFGTKAGDLFTRITIVSAAFWILLCMAAILVLNPQRKSDASSQGEGSQYTTLDASADGKSDQAGKADTAGGPAEKEPGDKSP